MSSVITSDGPDCNRGANSCCDPCQYDKITCIGDCCKCVPNLLCVRFVPDTPTDDCIAVHVLLGTELNDFGIYSGSLRNVVGKGLNVSITITMGKIYGSSTCAWNVRIPELSIDEDFEIDGIYVTCQSPEFDIVIENGYCPGTIHIAAYSLAKVPFFYGPIPITEENFTCGTCDKVCSVICVKYTLNDIKYRRQFVWNYGKWENTQNNDDTTTDTITPVDVGSTCELHFDIKDIPDILPLLIDACGIGTSSQPGLIFETTSYGGVFIEGSCNNCTCWDYICGTCRCACDAICLMLQSGYGLPQPMELPWDPIEHRWGDESYSITLSEDVETGGCLMNVPGWDPFPVDSCGIDINFSLEDDDGNRAFGACKNCHCFNEPAECCGTNLYELPLVLVATVENQALCSCFVPTTVYLLFNPTGTQWSGEALSPCPSVPGGPTVMKIRIMVNCASGSDCPGLLQWEVCNSFTGWVQESCTCPPLLLKGKDLVIDTSCCNNEPMAGGTLKVTVTM